MLYVDFAFLSASSIEIHPWWNNSKISYILMKVALALGLFPEDADQMLISWPTEFHN